MTFPVVADPGIRASIELAVSELIWPLAPPKNTSMTPGSLPKLDPDIKTGSLIAPCVLLMPCISGICARRPNGITINIPRIRKPTEFLMKSFKKLTIPINPKN
jgi:hypothetical protein